MDYVNPIHWDQRFAEKSKFGDPICPQAMVAKLEKSDWGFPIVQIAVRLTNQQGKTVVTSLDEVQVAS